MSKFQGVKWGIFGQSGMSLTGRSTVIGMIAEQAIHDRSKKTKADCFYEIEMQGHYHSIASSTKENVAIAIGDTPASAIANAKLIAAAPELLALLIESQDGIGGDWRQRRDELVFKLQQG